MVEKYKDEWISILDDSVLALKFKRWSGVSGKIYFVSNILHHVNNELSHILLLQRSICKWNIMCFNLMFLPNSSFIWCTLFPSNSQKSSGNWERKVAPAIQNANVNFAERPTLMPRSPWLAETEQKGQLMCLHVWRGSHLQFQRMINRKAVKTLPADNTKMVIWSLWLSPNHFGFLLHLQAKESHGHGITAQLISHTHWAKSIRVDKAVSILEAIFPSCIASKLAAGFLKTFQALVAWVTLLCIY